MSTARAVFPDARLPRVARAYTELFAGLQEGVEPDLRTFPNEERYSQMVAVTGIPFHSLCAHHFLPFFGTAHLAYLPGERILGLSKLARVVEFYARRPQVQERMTEQAIELLDRRLKPAGVMVVVQARHFCMEMRGMAKAGALTTTSAVRAPSRRSARARSSSSFWAMRAGSESRPAALGGLPPLRG